MPIGSIKPHARLVEEPERATSRDESRQGKTTSLPRREVSSGGLCKRGQIKQLERALDAICGAVGKCHGKRNIPPARSARLSPRRRGLDTRARGDNQTGSSSTDLPSQISRPAAGLKKPAMIRSKLDLPLPFAPRSRSASPGRSSNDTPENTRRPARIQARCSAVSRGMLSRATDDRRSLCRHWLAHPWPPGWTLPRKPVTALRLCSTAADRPSVRWLTSQSRVM